MRYKSYVVITNYYFMLCAADMEQQLSHWVKGRSVLSVWAWATTIQKFNYKFLLLRE